MNARNRIALQFLVPSLLFIVVFSLYPIIESFRLSFYRLILTLPWLGQKFVGWENYSDLLTDPVALKSLLTTLLFVGVTAPLEVMLGLGMALVLNESFRGRGWVRAIAILPWALPTAVMAMSWRWIFNDTYGVFNDILMRFGVISEPVAWLGDPVTAMMAIVAADVWKTTPFITIILLAGLQSIPRDLYEALRLDGAGSWQRFRMLTLPMLRPALVLALTFRLIQALGVFDLVWVMTGGGPAGGTRTVALYIYDNLFRYLDMDYGSLITVAFMISVFGMASAAGMLVKGKAAA